MKLFMFYKSVQHEAVPNQLSIRTKKMAAHAIYSKNRVRILSQSYDTIRAGIIVECGCMSSGIVFRKKFVKEGAPVKLEGPVKQNENPHRYPFGRNVLRDIFEPGISPGHARLKNGNTSIETARIFC